MKKLNVIYKLSLVALLLALGGCASVVKAPAHLDAKAKQFKSNKNYSQVYVYRNEMFGAALSMSVTVDGKLAGTTGANSYFKFNLPAGNHTFKSEGDDSVLKIKTALGKLYFIWQEMKMGMFSGSTKLQVVKPSEGRNGVLESTLIDSPVGK